MRVLVTYLALSLLPCGCAGFGPGRIISHDSVSGDVLSAAALSPDLPKSFKRVKEFEKCFSGGGTWNLPSINFKNVGTMSGSLSYGENTCPANPPKLEFASYLTAKPQACAAPLSGTDPGIYVTLERKHSDVTFSGNGLTGSITSSLLKTNTSYTIYVTDATEQTVYFQEIVGPPDNGTIEFSSPFQNGFAFPDTSYFLVCA